MKELLKHSEVQNEKPPIHEPETIGLVSITIRNCEDVI